MQEPDTRTRKGSVSPSAWSARNASGRAPSGWSEEGFTIPF